MDCNRKESIKKDSCCKKARQKLLNEFASNVTLHGFRYLVEEQGIRRIIWFIITNICFTIFAYVSLAALKDFFEYKVITRSKTIYDRSNAEFPTVTICPIGIGSFKKVSKIKLPNGLNTDNFLKALQLTYGETFVNESSPILQNFLEIMKSENYTVKQMIQLYQPTLEDITKSIIMNKINNGKFCHFQGVPCDIESFTAVGTWFSPLCYQFNSYALDKKPLVITYAKTGFGLNLVLDIGSYADKLYSLFPFNGFLVTFDIYGSSQKMLESTRKFILNPGHYTFIEITTKKTILLPPPYETMCGSKPYKILRDRPYSKEMCFLDCISEAVYKECGCLGHDMEELTNVEICKIEQMISYFTTLRKTKKQLSKYCRERCPLQCGETSYNVDVTEGMLGISSKLSRNFTLENKTEDDDVMQYIRKQMVALNINFKDFKEFHDTSVPAITWVSLIGTIGGSLGLCLGFSLVTLFEFVFFFFNCACVGSKRKNRLRSNNHDKETEAC